MSLQDDKVTFCTSDDPPVKITASRITLIANSTVFRDMFSLPDTSTKEEPIHLSETEEEFQLFLSAMDGDEEVRKRLDQVGEEEEYEARWIALTKLADKYDSLSVRRFVEVRIWKEIAYNGQSGDGFGFTLAIQLNSKGLIEAAAPHAMRLRDDGINELKVAQIWKTALRASKAERAITVLEELKRWREHEPDRHVSHYCRKTGCAISREWKDLLASALAGFDIQDTPPLPLTKRVDELDNCCSEQRMKLRAKAIELEEVFRPIFRFPEE